MSSPTNSVALFKGAFEKPAADLLFESDASSDEGFAPRAVAAKRTGLFATIAPLIAEHGGSSRMLHSMARMLASCVLGLAYGCFDCSACKHLRRDPAQRHVGAYRIPLDQCGTVDPAYDQQNFSTFDRYYDSSCLFALLGFLTVDDQAKQHFFAARLRPSTPKESRVSAALPRWSVGRVPETIAS